MADRLRVTELDFDTIKTNLKAFLKQQAEFTDYDFDGAGLSVLIDLLAYNTHYNAYYLNMIANESFLDTALLRDSVVSHAKTLGYTPFSRKSASATINFTVQTDNVTTGTLIIPKGFRFLSNQIDGVVYNFIVLNDTTVTKSNTNYTFENLVINEGILNSYRFVHDNQSNPKQIFTLPDVNIDTSTLTVTVSPSVSNTAISTYQLALDVTEVNATSEVYFLQESRSGKFQIYFGDDVLGKSLPDGAIVTATYLVTNGTAANKANNFVAAATLTDSNAELLTEFVVQPISAANGGSERETVDKIKYGAPLQYASQNRLVSYKDYEIYIRKSYPNLDSVSVWGGEDEVPPIYGKVFISLKPTEGFYISETEKARILNTVVDPRAVVSIITEFRDPEYLFVNTTTNVQYDPKKTTRTSDALKVDIRNGILFYKNTFLDQFNARFAISKLQEAVDSVDTNSIVGSETTIRVQKRFTPVLGRVSNYVVNFNVPLLQGTTFNKLSSNEFRVNDSSGIVRTVTLEEVPKSFTGVNSIEILNPGTGYTSEPTVTITGDGFGATARAIISLGRIERIEVTNPGIDYNRAVVTITGGGGFGASALAVIDTRVGRLRTVYFTENAERVVVKSDVGQIDYDNGIVSLTDINVLSVVDSDGLIRINSGLQNNIIQSERNTILTIDETDPASIVINLQAL
jgi:hypothetical protein